MLTQTLPTFGTPYPSEPASSLPHHQSATYVNSPSTPPYPPSLNPSSPLPTSSTPTTTTTNDAKIPHLPPELWLQIFPSILSSPEELTNLHLVCRAFHSLLVQHEGSLVREVMRTQTISLSFLPSRRWEGEGQEEQEQEQNRKRRLGREGGGEGGREGRADGDARLGRNLSLCEIRKLVFPLPLPGPSPSSSSVPAFTDLWSLHYRLARLEECEEVWRRCVSWGPEFAWEKRRWEGVHFAGMLALVRLRDVGALGRLRVEDGGGRKGGGLGGWGCGIDGEDGEDDMGRMPPPPHLHTSSRPPPSSPSSAERTRRRRSHQPLSPSRAATTTSPPSSSSSSSSSLSPALDSHTARLTHLLSLPPPTLALLLFKLHTALRLLRVLGPEPLRTTTTTSSSSVPSPHHRPGDSTTTPREGEAEEVWWWHDGNGRGVTRCEVEVVAEECFLGFGPEVLVGLVGNGAGDGDCEWRRDADENRETVSGNEQQKQQRRRQSMGRWARSLFETELQSLHSRQQPFPDGSPKPPTLIACLRRTFAEKTGVAFAETEGKMWEILASLEIGVDGDGWEGVFKGL